MREVHFFNGTPWDTIGKKVGECATVADAMKLAGQDWPVVHEPIFDKDGNSLAKYGKLVLRGDNRTVLGVVGPNTHALQNADAWNFFQPFIESGECKFDTAGMLGGGKKLWALAKINRDDSEIVPGDNVSKWLLLSNSHDGTMAVRVGFCQIRVVCGNTLYSAIKSKESELIRIRHGRNVKENLMEIQQVIDAANATFEATAEQYRALASRNINQGDLVKYIKLVLQLKEDDEAVSTRSKNIVSEIVGLFENGKGNNLPKVKGTYWAAYNGITEYLSYNKGKSAETRLDSLWFGQNASVNKRAFEQALSLAA